MNASKCPVCQVQALSDQVPNADAFKVDCANCGKYIITRTERTCLPTVLQEYPDGSARLSHAIRKHQSDSPFPLRNPRRLIESTPLPKPQEQVENLIRWLGTRLKGLGHFQKVPPSESIAIIGAWSESNVTHLLEEIRQKGLIRSENFNDGRSWTLTMSGWQLFHELSIQSKDTRTAFMAMKFNESKLDDAYENCFKPAVQQAGFELARLDERPTAGLIDDRLMVEIRKARFMVSDLTHCNLGVYWESGFAHGLGKHVFYTCNREYFDSKKPHFDINHHHIVLWCPSEYSKAADELTAAVRNTLHEEANQSDE